MAFHVIAVTEGLTGADRSRAMQAGPPDVTAEADYQALVATAGFTNIRVRDDSASYRDTAASWLRESERDAGHLEALFGAEVFRDQQARRRDTLDAINRGLLRRYMVLAQAPR